MTTVEENKQEEQQNEENLNNNENPEEEKKIEIPIFDPSQIDLIYNSPDPINEISLILQSHFRRVFLRADFDVEKIMGQSEFHVNNLIFLKENFATFPNEILCKLLNIMSELIEFKNEEEIKENEEENFLQISKNKLNEFKNNLISNNLYPNTKGDTILANDVNKKLTEDGKFFLNIKEIQLIIEYLKREYFPYIQMWFYFDKDERKITEEKIELIINKPLDSMPLNIAIEEEIEDELNKKEEELTEEQKLKEEEEAKLKEEEEKKKKEEEEKLKEEEENKKEEEKEETYLDVLNRLGLNEETKKIIIEKIEELHKDVEGKIDGRQKELEDKVKEIEDTVKGPKKK
jgi:hypothetical protein